MADGRAHGPVVVGGIGQGIVVGRLQVGGGEVQGVLDRQVHRIDGLGRHPPGVAIHRLAQLGEVAVELEALAEVDVQQGVVRDDLQALEVAPLVRIADQDLERGELGLGAGLGGGRHPGQAVDPASEGGGDVAGHHLDLGFGLGREPAPGVEPADRLAQGVISRIDCALPPGRLFGRALDGFGVEGEVLVGEGLGQDVGKGVQDLVAEVGFPRLQRLGPDQLRLARHG